MAKLGKSLKNDFGMGARNGGLAPGGGMDYTFSQQASYPVRNVVRMGVRKSLFSSLREMIMHPRDSLWVENEKVM